MISNESEAESEIKREGESTNKERQTSYMSKYKHSSRPKGGTEKKKKNTVPARREGLRKM